MRSGRPRKLLQKKTCRKILADLGVVVHHSTVQQCLHRQDLHGRVSRRKPYLQTQHQRYATEYLQKPDAFWKHVLWTDKVKTELFVHNQQWHVNMPTIKHWGGSIMLCYCAAASGSGNIARVKGRTYSSKYQQILEANIILCVKS